LLPLKKSIFVVLFSLSASLLSSCSEESSARDIHATLFLLDASKSSIISITQREQQLRERLNSAFERKEAIYFDFIRNNSTKQLISSLVSMQTIVGVDDIILSKINNERRQTEARDSVSELWRQSLINTKSTEDCINQGTTSIEVKSVLDDQEARRIAQFVCTSANKAKEVFAAIRVIGSGVAKEGGYIGSDIQGAFSRGYKKMESDSNNLYSPGDVNYSVKRRTIVVSSDMMQVSDGQNRIIDSIRDKNEEEIVVYLKERIGQPNISGFVSIVKIDGWLNTKKNFSEIERQVLETYWKKWFELSFELLDIDFGLGVIDWSVDQ
jgi:hypothetical protein